MLVDTVWNNFRSLKIGSVAFGVAMADVHPVWNDFSLIHVSRSHPGSSFL